MLACHGMPVPQAARQQSGLICVEALMRPTWLIEAGVYGDEALPLLDEIRRQGLTPSRRGTLGEVVKNSLAKGL